MLKPSDKTQSLEKQRTQLQNNSMHLWFRFIAEALNDAGLTVREVLEHFTMDIEWTEKSVKYDLWGTAQRRMFKKDSTTRLTTKEVTEIEKVVKRFLEVELKIDIKDFPSIDTALWGPIVKKHDKHKTYNNI